MCFNFALIDKNDKSTSLLNKVIEFSEVYVSSIFCGRKYYVIHSTTSDSINVKIEIISLTTARKIFYIILTILIAPLIVCSFIKLLNRCSASYRKKILILPLEPFVQLAASVEYLTPPKEMFEEKAPVIRLLNGSKVIQNQDNVRLRQMEKLNRRNQTK